MDTTTYSSTALRQLLKYLRPFRQKVIFATFFSILNKIFDLAPAILIGAAVDVVVKGEESLIAGFGISDPTEQLIGLAIVTAVIWVLESFFEYLFKVYWRDLAQYVQDQLRKDAYANLQKQEMDFFEDISSADLISILYDDINQLERLFYH